MLSPDNDEMTSVSPAFNKQHTPELMTVSPFTPNLTEADIQSILHKKDELESERNNLAVQIDCYNNESQVIDSLPKDQLKDLYEELQQNLLQKTTVKDGRQLIKNGECLTQATLSTLQCDLLETPNKLSLERKRELEKLLFEYAALASQVAEKHQEITELKANLEAVKKDNFELLQKSRELYDKIGEQKKAKEEELVELTKNETGKSIHEQLQKKLQIAEIQNNTLQMLILGSGYNWSQDKHLNKLVLDSGKKLSI